MEMQLEQKEMILITSADADADNDDDCDCWFDPSQKRLLGVMQRQRSKYTVPLEWE